MKNKDKTLNLDLAPIERRNILVSGKVQGVGYRKFVVGHAVKLSLTGFCKNLPSGEVEVEAEGPSEKIQELVRHLHQGPPGGEVEKVIVSSALTLKHNADFTIAY
ncbi:MAG: acylphosphatase [Nitrospirae bacterium]|nr:acylphosphatase [Nitrospirota bacterium]MBI3351882.1 acylphosphatase [Nitrospirota bacterium]